MDARHNFRSNKRECHIPVQLQLARDDEYLAETLALSSGTGQVFDSEQSDTSTSDIDIYALLDHSDQNLSSPHLASSKGAQAGSLGRVSSASEGRDSVDSVSQSDINQIILAQLSALGECLDILKKLKLKSCPRKQVICQKLNPLPNGTKVLKLKSHSLGSNQVCLPLLVQCITCHHQKILNQVLKKLNHREVGLLRSL